MVNLLQRYFPMIRSRDEVLSKIHSNTDLDTLFNQWTADEQEEFLNFTSGVRGIKVLYDSFFKELMNPETVPERLSDFLSLLLRQSVKIVQVLPNDTTRITDEGSLVIMDIVAELDNGTIVNIEVQKIGYAFPGQRCACYSSDLLLRQYKRVRSQASKRRKFSYRNIKTVYTIVLFETSTSAFHKYDTIYLHNFEQKSDSGLKMELLQKYTFVPLDIFKTNLQNNGIRSKLDAWLTFLSVDDPKWIIEVIRLYPEFKAMYEHAYDICMNIEKVMDMFSKELYELDRNTVLYMIDEMQEEIDRKRAELESTNVKLESANEKLESTTEKLESTTEKLESTTEKLESTAELLKRKDEELQRIQEEK